MQLEPIPTLQRRIVADLSQDFVAGKPIRFSRAPGRLDVMGGIADYTGSLVCEATLGRAAAVALQERADRLVQICSLNLLDQGQPFTFSITLETLATISLAELHEQFTKPAQRWAGYLAGCLFLLRESGLIDLADPKLHGMNLALYSTVPLGAGVSSSAAIEVATMMNLIEHLGLRDKIDPLQMSTMCKSVENRVVGAPCGIMDQVSCCAGEQASITPPLRQALLAQYATHKSWSAQLHHDNLAADLSEHVRRMGYDNDRATLALKLVYPVETLLLETLSLME